MILQIQPWIDDTELIQLKRVIDSTFVTEAELTKEFEEMTKKLTCAKHAIAVANGTLGLYCALKALGIGTGDEVIVPDLTFIASANAVIMAGATPVFCDIDINTFCIDVKSAQQKVTNRTKAIMPVHLYGQSADMAAVLSFAKKNNLKIVEDAAQGVGVFFEGKHVGTFGEIGILSYYGNKTITCGEGGIILTNDDELAKSCYRLKNHGRDTKGVFYHEHIGFNFSFTEMQAAIGIAQMNKLEKIIKRKEEIRNKYTDGLAEIKEIQQAFIDNRCTPVFWFTSIIIDDVEGLATYLRNSQIQTRRFFNPLHLQPCYSSPTLNINIDAVNFSNATFAFEHGLSLPSSYLLTNDEQNLVIEKIKTYYNSK